MVSTMKQKKSKTSKFVDPESNNWNYREGNLKNGMDKLEIIKKETKTSQRCGNVDTLNKKTHYLSFA